MRTTSSPGVIGARKLVPFVNRSCEAKGTHRIAAAESWGRAISAGDDSGDGGTANAVRLDESSKHSAKRIA
jgi:hypothetical protein